MALLAYIQLKVSKSFSKQAITFNAVSLSISPVLTFFHIAEVNSTLAISKKENFIGFI